MNPKMKPETTQFRFDERKATAAASHLLQLAGGAMPYLQLIKLLYLSDRESLELFGRPVSGDRYVAMKHGPVLSSVYDLIKLTVSGKPSRGPWAEHIESAGRYELRLRMKPDLGPLSDAEVKLIASVYDRFRNHDRWRLRDETHALKEWEAPGESSREIPLEEILQALGKGEDEIEEVRQTAREGAYFDSIFGA